MKNIRLVSEILKEKGLYPFMEDDENGLLLQIENNELVLSGSSINLKRCITYRKKHE